MTLVVHTSRCWPTGLHSIGGIVAEVGIQSGVLLLLLEVVCDKLHYWSYRSWKGTNFPFVTLATPLPLSAIVRLLSAWSPGGRNEADSRF